MTWKMSKHLFLIKKSNTFCYGFIFLLIVPKGINFCLFLFVCFKEEVYLTLLQRVEMLEKNLLWMVSSWFCAQVWTCGILSTSQGMGVCKSLYSSAFIFHYTEKSPLAKLYPTWQWLGEECAQKFRYWFLAC